VGFSAVIQALQAQLENDTALQAFTQSAWGKALTVEQVFKDRTEVRMSDLPLIMITRPEVRRTELSNVRDGHHTVRLYCGFHSQDKHAAAVDMIDFEEAIDNAIDADDTLGGTCIQALPGDSVNDEGKFHPVYFIVKDLSIHHRQW